MVGDTVTFDGKPSQRKYALERALEWQRLVTTDNVDSPVVTIELLLEVAEKIIKYMRSEDSGS